jgi:hypothetical protein
MPCLLNKQSHNEDKYEDHTLQFNGSAEGNITALDRQRAHTRKGG